MKRGYMAMEISAPSSVHTAILVSQPISPPAPSKFQLILDATCDIFAIGACLAITLVMEKITPRHGYAVKEKLFEYNVYPHKANSVPSWSVPIYSLIGPVVLFVVYGAIFRRPAMEVFRLVRVFVLAVFLTAAITNAVKVPVGRFRPNFVQTCWPDGQIVFTHEDAYGGYPKCSCSESESNEIRKSFPSGHSSWSAAGLGFTTYFLLGQLQAFTGNGQVWKFFVAVLPGLGAVAVAITRVVDYWHHPSDVLTGLALGFLTSFFVYRMFYPTLIHQHCNVPTYCHGALAAKGTAASEADDYPSAPRQRHERVASALPY